MQNLTLDYADHGVSTFVRSKLWKSLSVPEYRQKRGSELRIWRNADSTSNSTFGTPLKTKLSV